MKRDLKGPLLTACLIVIVLLAIGRTGTTGSNKASFPEEMDKDFGELREEIKGEWAQHRKEVRAEVQAEREKIMALYDSEKEAIKDIWGKVPDSDSIKEVKLDPVYKNEVNYKDGKLKSTSVVVADSEEEINEAKNKGADHSLNHLQNEVRKLRPTNDQSVEEELDKKGSSIDSKDLDRFVAKNSEKKVEGIVDLPKGKKGVKVSTEIPISGPEKPGIAKVLDPMLPDAEEDAKELEPEVPKPRPQPPFDANAWLNEVGPLNGVILDTRGTGFKPCIYPRLMATKEAGGLEVVYYKRDRKKSPAGGAGLSGWARSIESARTEPRLTSGPGLTGKPLIIGPKDIIKISENKIVLSSKATAKIKSGNKKYGYLKHARLVIVVD